MAEESSECVLQIVYTGEPVEIIHKGDKICVIPPKADNGGDDDGIKNPIGIAASRNLAAALTASVGKTAAVSIGGPIDLDIVLPAIKSSNVRRVIMAQSMMHD